MTFHLEMSVNFKLWKFYKMKQSNWFFWQYQENFNELDWNMFWEGSAGLEEEKITKKKKKISALPKPLEQQ